MTPKSSKRLAVVVSHPIQYLSPLFRQLATQVQLKVFYGHRATPADQQKIGFGVGFEWDVDLLSGYDSTFLTNKARKPSVARFNGIDTPEIGSRLDEGRFDAVLLEGWYLKFLIQAAFAARRRGIPVFARGDSQLLTPRSPFKRMAKDLFFPIFLRLFDAALFAGKRSRAYWEHYRYPPEKMFFSPHGVDTTWFRSRATDQARAERRSRMGYSPETKVALFAGKLIPFKRPLDLVPAIASLRNDGLDARILVAGSGQLEGELKAAAAAARVPINMLGFCNQSEMPAVYAAADVLVLPSDGRETWGLVANEALACGRPLVLSDAVGCAPDLAADEVAGMIFPVGDVAALAQAIRKVVLEPPVPAAIAAKSNEYSLDTAASGIIQALAAGGKTSPAMAP